jgi:preprotein translocase subunit SecG
MKKILSLFTAVAFLTFAQTSVLAQKATPSGTPKNIKPTTINDIFLMSSSSPSATFSLSSTPAAVKRVATPKPEQMSLDKILSSMPKASFVVFVVILFLLLIEIYLLKKKNSIQSGATNAPSEVFQEKGGNDKKTKKILTLLILIFVLISIPLTLVLVKQRQEVRKKAAETMCCKIMAKNLCSGAGLGSFDLFVREFATEAQCDSYLQNPESQSYSCECTEHCTVGNDHDVNQVCPGTTEGKSRCTTAGSGNFRKEIINQAACGGVTTPPPTVPPTTPPTTPPTATPTVAPTTTPTIRPTTTPVITPTVAPTNTPAPLSCNQGPCNVAGKSCASGLVCASDYGNVCRKNECQIESDCTCKTALSCNQGPCNVANTGCASGLVCIHDTWFGHDQWVCRTNECQIESDCICKQAQNTPAPTKPPIGGKTYIPPAAGQLPHPSPTISVPVIPQAGLDGPTLLTVSVGVLLLIAGLALAL